LSPLDGIGPDQIGLNELREIATAPDAGIKEVIIATNPTVEGEATAQFIADMLPEGIEVSRIAHGVPIGGELEMVDGGTLSHALSGRRAISKS